ncbi:MAG: cation:proton antiporter [Spirochaetes bacterium]|nr:MAG: cation:proton antiporter [Spirochaetota bacterium]
MINIYLYVIVFGALLCIIRMAAGPTASDRAVALDTLSTVTTALLVILGFVFHRKVYIDVALVYALLTFIGSVAIARFLERGV